MKPLSKMPKFLVERIESYYVPVVVEADSEAEALELARIDEVQHYFPTEFREYIGMEHWEVTELTEKEVEAIWPCTKEDAA